MTAPRSHLVYSTDGGRMCPDCRQPMDRCACRQTPVRPATDGTVRVSCESKGRGGKSVTIVRGLPTDPLLLAQIGKELRTACGSGGTVKDGAVEVQGDHTVLVMAVLTAKGWTVKQAGGRAR